MAACVAGAFSLEDGLKLIASRARLMQALPQQGKMGTVLLDRFEQVARRVTFKPLRLPMVCHLTGQLLPIRHQQSIGRNVNRLPTSR